jgi:DNA-binding NtrC family response regulator
MAERICLIVDDDESIRTYLAEILKNHQLQCLQAMDALQALAILHKVDGRVDLVISDILMPGDMNGVDLAHAIRHAYPAIPIILISGFAGTETLRTSGFPFIQKPFLGETICNAVDKLLGSGGSTSATP